MSSQPTSNTVLISVDGSSEADHALTCKYYNFFLFFKFVFLTIITNISNLVTRWRQDDHI